LFSRVELLCGDSRKIAVLDRDGDEPCVSITRWRRDEPRPIGALYVHARDLDVLDRALAFARTAPSGKLPAGIIRGKHERELRVLGYGAEPKGPAVVLLVHDRFAGKRHGGLTSLAGPELDALERAVAWCRQRAAEAGYR
jgi:hypothetical protein